MTDTSIPGTGDQTAHVPTDDELIQEYARLTVENRRLNQQKADNAARMSTIEQRVIDIFLERGYRSTDLIGIGNLHLKKTGAAKLIRDDGNYRRPVTNAEREAGRQALENAGLGDLIKRSYTMQTVTSWWKGELEQGHPIPEELADAFIFEDGWTLNLTDAAKPVPDPD